MVVANALHCVHLLAQLTDAWGICVTNGEDERAGTSMPPLDASHITAGPRFLSMATLSTEQPREEEPFDMAARKDTNEGVPTG